VYAEESCHAIYKKAVTEKVATHEKINGFFPYTASTATIFAFINPIVSAVLLGTHYGAILLSSRYGSDQANIFNLELLDSPYGKKLYDDVIAINSELSNLDILRIINYGFESGDFCKELPALYTIDDVTDYVLKKTISWTKSGKINQLSDTPLEL
jgi:hypothetical protein